MTDANKVDTSTKAARKLAESYRHAGPRDDNHIANLLDALVTERDNLQDENNGLSERLGVRVRYT